MAEGLLFDETIRYWALFPLAVGVVLVGALRYLVYKLGRFSQSAKIVKQGLSSSLSLSLVYAGGLFRLVVIRAMHLLAAENFIPSKSFRPNEDQWLPSSNSCLLPEDLVIDQILSRLPVKSLVRFKSVCKRWHALPTNPSFIAAHLKHINTPNRLASWNGNEDGLIVRHDGFHVFTVCCGTANFQPVNLNFGFDRKPDLVLGPCDGIFCLYWRPHIYNRAPEPSVDRLPTIGLWNPATRAFSILPKSIFDFPPYKTVTCCMVGFGFDLATKGIKVVKVVNFFCGDSSEATINDYINCAEVYDLGSSSWRVLDMDDIPQDVCVSDMDTSCIYNINDGVFHWLSALLERNLEGRSVDLVLSFDMSRELFHVTMIPKTYGLFDNRLTFLNMDCYLSLLRDSLAVNISYFKGSGQTTVEIWLMKKGFDRVVEAGVSFSSHSWSHELTMEFPCPCVLMVFWNKKEFLMWKMTWWFEGTPFMYDVETKQARDLQLSGELNFLYKESLVSVNGGCGSESIPY